MAVQAQHSDKLSLHYLHQLQYLNAATQSGLTSLAPPSKKRPQPESLPPQTKIPAISSASTSGRTAAAPSPLAQHLLSSFYNQNAELDAIVRLHTERLRSDLQQACNKHNNALLSTIEQQAAKRLKYKDAELEAAYRRNAELEEKIRHVAGEKEAWMSIARNNEAVIGNLHSTIEQLLHHQNVAVAGGGDDCGPSFPAEDVQSCCYEPDSGDRTPEVSSRRACRACDGGDVSVLVLPCRHLCLCRDCESKVDTCPVCRSAKNASLQVFMA